MAVDLWTQEDVRRSLAGEVGAALETVLLCGGDAPTAAMYLGGACALARHEARVRGICWREVVEVVMDEMAVAEVRRMAERHREMGWVGRVLQTTTVLGLLELIEELRAGPRMADKNRGEIHDADEERGVSCQLGGDR